MWGEKRGLMSHRSVQVRSISRMRFYTLAAAAVVLISGCGQNSKPAGPAASTTAGANAGSMPGQTLQIAVIPKGTTHEYWKSVHAGAVKAEQELQAAGTKVKIIWKGPLREDDRNGQTDVVETFVTQGVQGIVLAPLDSEALVRPAEDAVAKGIPVVVMDSALDSKKAASFVATDNL